MVNEQAMFWGTVLGTLVGIAVLLLGVAQTTGQFLNTTMVVGGVIVTAAVGLLAYWGFRLPEPEGEDHGH